MLVEKLKAYTRRLIKTLLAHSANSTRTDELPSFMVDEQDRGQRSVLDLKDDSFPLVCTFDTFLGMLESTAIAVDR